MSVSFKVVPDTERPVLGPKGKGNSEWDEVAQVAHEGNTLRLDDQSNNRMINLRKLFQRRFPGETLRIGKVGESSYIVWAEPKPAK